MTKASLFNVLIDHITYLKVFIHKKSKHQSTWFSPDGQKLNISKQVSCLHLSQNLSTLTLSGVYMN